MQTLEDKLRERNRENSPTRQDIVEEPGNRYDDLGVQQPTVEDEDVFHDAQEEPINDFIPSKRIGKTSIKKKAAKAAVTKNVGISAELIESALSSLQYELAAD